MKEQCRMIVGVEDLKLELAPCPIQPGTHGSLTISFAIEGHFLKAGHSDALDDTIDYGAISEDLRSLAKHYCCQDSSLLEQIRASFKNYSSIISGGFITSKLACHTVFLSQKTLL